MTSPLRILYISHSFWPLIGGIEVMAARLLPALAARGHYVSVATVHGAARLPDHDDFHGVKVHRFRIDGKTTAAQFHSVTEAHGQLRELIADVRPHVVHVNGLSPLAFALGDVDREKTPPVVVSLHSAPAFRPTSRGETVGERILQRADWITACSTSVLEAVCAVNPSARPRSSVLRNYVEVPPIAPAPLVFEPPTILAVARLVQVKGIDVLLSAVSLLAPRYPDVRTVIAGDGEARESLSARTSALGLQGRVTFSGWLRPLDVYAAMNAATIVAVPSRSEGFGMTAVEAALMGRPVVASRVGGLPEAVHDDRSGILVEPENPRALADGIERLLREPALARTMGAFAREQALATFTESAAIESYETLYRSVSAED